MVVTANLNFPFSESSTLSSQGVLICTSTNPYKSNNNYKSFNCNAPISIGLSFTNYQSQPMTITVSNVLSNASINVYKNGVFYYTVPNTYYSSTPITKSFLMSSSSSQTVFYFNSYVFNIGFQRFYPDENTNYGTTDTYEFYCPITYTVSSTVSPLVYISNFSISYLIDCNTTVSLSSFSNFNYIGFSSDTLGYAPYSLIDYPPSYADVWNGTVENSYYPTLLWSLWQGFIQIAVLYCTKIYMSYGDLVFKQQTNSLNNQRDQQIQWITNDASNGQLISKIYASTLGSSLNFFNNPSFASNFIFQNGIVNCNSGSKIGLLGTSIKSLVCFFHIFGSSTSYNRTGNQMVLPNIYSNVDKLVIFIQPYYGGIHEFSVTISNIITTISSTIVTYNVRRLDSTSGWDLSLNLAVFVIELS